MNLRTVDLNLLVILDALLSEAHVSRAATRLGLSQPAVSNALERCRQLFNDPLLERGRRIMHLSPKALTLQTPLSDLLREAVTLISPQPRDLRDIRQVVRIIMADHPATMVLPKLHLHLASSAPGIDLIVQPWQGEAAAYESLYSGSSDLVAAILRRDEPPIERKELVRDRYLAVMRKGHPAARRFNLDRWLEYPHVIVSGRGGTRGQIDQTLSGLGRSRRIGIVVPSFAMVPGLLEHSDLIALLPGRCVPENSKHLFAVRSPPISVEDFLLHLAWHPRRASDLVTQHIAAAICNLMS